MWLPVDRQLAAERAALRRAAGTEQGGDRREARRGAGEDLAPQLRHSAAAADARRSALTPAAIPRYAGLDPSEIPLTESLKDTVERFLPYWHDVDRARRSTAASAC